MDYERRALHAEHGVNATPSTFKRAVRHALKMVRMRKVVRVSRHLRQETFLRLWSCGYCVCVGLGLLCVCGVRVCVRVSMVRFLRVHVSVSGVPILFLIEGYG